MYDILDLTVLEPQILIMISKTKIFFVLKYDNKRYFASQLLKFVPKYAPVLDSDVFLLKNYINNYNKILVLTGAGISTESGAYLYLKIKLNLLIIYFVMLKMHKFKNYLLINNLIFIL